jgi:hypothetical protein
VITAATHKKCCAHLNYPARKENPEVTTEPVDMDRHINDRYAKAIEYYWNASKGNKAWYKLTRSLTVIFGALVTLIASLSSSKHIDGPILTNIFDFGTPIIAALLTVIAGFSQSFQWGSTWQNMVLTAQFLQKEYDRYLVTEPSERDYKNEADILNNFLLKETEGFFERMLGIAKIETTPEKKK